MLADVGAAPAIDPARAALLSPFDSLIWMRDRTERLFGMKFRLEIYVPQGKRVHGYYVLPFLLGDRLVARVDLKRIARRARCSCRQLTANRAPTTSEIAAALAEELARMARWLSLDRVEVVGRGELAAALVSETRRRTRRSTRSLHVDDLVVDADQQERGDAHAEVPSDRLSASSRNVNELANAAPAATSHVTDGSAARDLFEPLGQPAFMLTLALCLHREIVDPTPHVSLRPSIRSRMSRSIPNS